MNISKLKVLLSTVECGSFSRVALEFGYTQSGVSHMMKSLEKELGFPLFIRNQDGVMLTKDGESIIPSIRALVNANNVLEQKISDVTGLKNGILRIGAFTSITKLVLQPILKVFHKDYSHVRFEILDGTTQELAKLLAENQIDIGFFSRQPCCEQFRYYPVLEDPMLAVLPKDHRLASKATFDVTDFAEDHFIMPTIEGEYDAIRIIRSSGVAVDTTYSTKDTYAALTLVEKGMGFALISELVIKSHDCNVAAIPLEIPQYRTLGMFTPAALSISPSAKKFITYCKSMMPSILAGL